VGYSFRIARTDHEEPSPGANTPSTTVECIIASEKKIFVTEITKLKRILTYQNRMKFCPQLSEENGIKQKTATLQYCHVYKP